MTTTDLGQVRETVLRFVDWLDQYGETSFDHQTFFASDFGRWAKALYYKKPLLGMLAVSPMIFSEAFVPSARKLFWKRQRLPIADAHYAMGFAVLSQVTGEEKFHRRAVHFLEVLKETRCPAYKNYAWGYPFTWETRFGAMQEQTPLITTVPYAYEAFREVYKIDQRPEWRDIMHSIATHVFEDYYDFTTSDRAASCSYYPNHEHGVINASAYRACMLTQAATDFSDERYLKTAIRNLNFVIETQNADGSWFYSIEGERNFVDHFHTCFVLKALAKIEALTKNPECTRAIERGVDYYVKNLFDEEGMPKPFSRRPRLTVYKREGYDYAECINLGVLLAGRFPAFDKIAAKVSQLEGWQKRDGSFRSRQLFLGWDNVPMHRWAQSQMFRSLCLLLYQNQKGPN